MDIVSGFSLRFLIKKAIKRLSSIYLININKIIYIGWGWKLWYILRDNHKIRMWVGIGEVRRSNIMKMDIVEAVKNINHTLLYLGNINLCMIKMKFTLHIAILIPILI